MQSSNPKKQSEVLAALAQVLASPAFTRSKKQSAFLRYVIEYELAHPNTQLSSVDISADCFGRNPIEDPNDAYVRNIASQTRRSLNRYYAEQNLRPSIRFVLADKGYHVRFDADSPAPTTASPYEAARPTTVRAQGKLLPTIAVLPLTCLAGNSEHQVLGYILSDTLINSLAKSQYMRVISRRTTAQFSGAQHSSVQLGAMLEADYLVEGHFFVHGDSLRVQTELSCCDNNEVIWAEQLTSSVEAVVDESDDLVDRLIYGVTRQLLNHELQRALSTPLTSLECHSLLIGSINTMHRGTKNDVARARDMLSLLIQRNPHHATPYAHLSYLGLLDIIRDASGRKSLAAKQEVFEHANQALDRDSLHPIAMTAKGIALSHFERDLLGAQIQLEKALRVSPNEASAMGRMAGLQLYNETPSEALKTAEHAIKISPFDPELYLFHTGAAFASFAENRLEDAISHGQISSRLFPQHPSNLRLLVGAYTALGDKDNATKSKQKLLAAVPDFNLEEYLKGTHSPQHAVIQKLARYLEEAGIALQNQIRPRLEDKPLAAQHRSIHET